MNSVVVVAAGSGKRMNIGINKQFIKLGEKEVIAHTIQVFYINKDIDEIVVCIKPEEEKYFLDNIINKYNFKGVKIAYGGKERQDSIYNGLKKLDEKCNIVLIHDGARPFIDDKIIKESIEEAKVKKAVVVGVPVSDTIKIVKDGEIESTPDRSLLWAAQTPQVFDYNTIKKAYEDAYESGFYGTDDSMLVERIGQKVSMVMGSHKNIKITNQEDLKTANQIIQDI
ncbi:2-C-methyl-D-erythritol 4-phosphate cytidylyltransferase [Metaclostridioides mangenotii]|uniref:2-C-methyl-D-erythritol 4-phosphate cytidylyltransferase n=1 Tax=Metaclostridioides mangenotii TaxID=1540 RepID=A0ABS4EDH6_9FIRM|nr:2-C-methyl-D-erythritol 4-phosphate cytidylyltransferase [Clostridioides mangenotii]MBP1855993.1 2-C-methyl-D-erythritol 4-phosphate cytidylyltransferase [Clostridioides mangenotii]